MSARSSSDQTYFDGVGMNKSHDEEEDDEDEESDDDQTESGNDPEWLGR